MALIFMVAGNFINRASCIVLCRITDSTIVKMSDSLPSCYKETHVWCSSTEFEQEEGTQKKNKRHSVFYSMIYCFKNCFSFMQSHVQSIRVRKPYAHYYAPRELLSSTKISPVTISIQPLVKRQYRSNLFQGSPTGKKLVWLLVENSGGVSHT